MSRLWAGLWLRVLLVAFPWLLLCSEVPQASAQGSSIYGQVIQPAPPAGTGGPAAFAIVRICPYSGGGLPCSPTANLFADPGLTSPIANPYTTDQLGNYSVFVATGTYIVQIGATPTVTYTYLAFANGSATVSSVALSMPSIFSVTGSPITGAGMFTVTLATQSANQVFGNCTGSTATPTFCALTAGMIPSTLNATTFAGVTTPTLVINGSQVLDGVQGSAGTKIATASGSFTNGVLIMANATGDLVTSGIAAANLPLLNGTNSFTATNTFTTINAAVVNTPTFNAATGYQIGGSYGTAQLCLVSAGGAGTAFNSCTPFYPANGGASNLIWKIVETQVTLSGGTGTVTLTGTAIFAANPKCWGNDRTAANAVSVLASSGSSIGVTGTGTDVIDVYCITPPGIF